MTLLTVHDLTRRFGDREVVAGLSFDVSAGERMALAGQNGSGKTTVLRCVLGTLIPTAGSIFVGDHPAGASQARRLSGASLSQERSFFLRLSAFENLVFFAQLRGMTRSEARREVTSLSEELRLEPFLSERCDRCSAGQLQQLAFARALAGSPKLLLLDEPTRSLDAEARKRLWNAIDQRPSTAVLFASHLPEDLEHASGVHDLAPSG